MKLARKAFHMSAVSSLGQVPVALSCSTRSDLSHASNSRALEISLRPMNSLDRS
jgi:hypothetical protein